MTITCQQFLEWMGDFLDHDLDPVLAEAVREHSLVCAPCLVVLDTTRTSIHLLGDERNFAMPAGASARLRRALEQGLEESLLPADLRQAKVTPAAAGPRRSWFGAGPVRAWALAAAVALVVAVVTLTQWRTRVVTASGWLIDQHCMSAFVGHPQDHPKDCLMRCADSVYGILDAQGHFTPFNAKANSKVVAALKASRHNDHFWATVTATRASADSNSGLQVEQIALSEPDSR